MFDIGWQELIILMLIALIVVGPKDLPRIVKTAGQWMGKARGYARDFQRTIEEAADATEIDAVKKEIDEANRELSTAHRDVAEGADAIKRDVAESTDSMNKMLSEDAMSSAKTGGREAQRRRTAERPGGGGGRRSSGVCGRGGRARTRRRAAGSGGIADRDARRRGGRFPRARYERLGAPPGPFCGMSRQHQSGTSVSLKLNQGAARPPASAATVPGVATVSA